MIFSMEIFFKVDHENTYRKCVFFGLNKKSINFQDLNFSKRILKF